MSYFLRPATLADLRQMADVAGPPVTVAQLAEWMDGDSAYAAWHLIEDEAGTVLGFQHVGRSATLPAGACDIATFHAATPLPPGAAAALFDATATAARLLRYTWISASVAAGNEPARIYYQNRGFRPYGETADRLLLRYDLD